MRSLEQLDRWIAGKLKNWSSKVVGAPQRQHLLEIRRDILEDVRDRIQPIGEGKNVFPYNRISVQIGAPDAEQQTVYEAVFCDEDGLEHDIRELLIETGCPVPAGFSVAVAVVEGAHPFVIDYLRARGASLHSTRPDAMLTVIQGQADAAKYSIASDRFNIGRLKEVTGEREGLRRRNDVAFADTETTVSREHAYIRYDPDSSRFRLYDSGSERGTAIFRQGRRVEVPKGAARGVQLQSGDEIHIGNARLLFETAH
jgi:hypothetical protein